MTQALRTPGRLRDFGASSAAIPAWTLLFLAAMLWPLAGSTYPGLQDYPNHLARIFILLRPSDPILQQHYRIEWALLPNLAWDIWAVAVSQFLSLEWAGKLFIGLGCASGLVGCFLLNRALVGQWTPAPLLAAPILFNSAYAKGFLSFNLGLGLALGAAAWWVTWREDRWRLRLAGAIIFSTLLYVVHFHAWCIYGVFVFGSKLREMSSAPDRASRLRLLGATARDAIQAAPPVAMFYWTSTTISLESKWALGLNEFQPPYVRIGQIARLIDVGTDWVNLVFIAIVAGIIATALAQGWLRIRTGAAATLLILALLFFVLPEDIYGNFHATWRILIAAGLIAIASLAPTRDARPLLAATALTIVAITLVQNHAWRRTERARESLMRVIETLPEGGKLFFALSGVAEGGLVRVGLGSYHAGSHAVMVRRALVQSMFAYPGQQPIRFRKAWLYAAPSHSDTSLRRIVARFATANLDLQDHIRRFDHVLIYGQDDGPERAVLPMEALRLTAQSGDFRLYENAAAARGR